MIDKLIHLRNLEITDPDTFSPLETETHHAAVSIFHEQKFCLWQIDDRIWKETGDIYLYSITPGYRQTLQGRPIDETYIALKSDGDVMIGRLYFNELTEPYRYAIRREAVFLITQRGLKGWHPETAQCWYLGACKLSDCLPSADPSDRAMPYYHFPLFRGHFDDDTVAGGILVPGQLRSLDAMERSARTAATIYSDATPLPSLLSLLMDAWFGRFWVDEEGV